MDGFEPIRGALAVASRAVLHVQPSRNLFDSRFRFLGIAGHRVGCAKRAMRLYRGLNEPYRPERVGAGQPHMFGTDFTDCPYTALQFARGRRGVLLVVDAAAGRLRVSEELWPGGDAKRLMVWGTFDAFLVAAIPARQLRVHLRRKGIVAASRSYKATVLKRAIETWIEGREEVACPSARGSPASPENRDPVRW